MRKIVLTVTASLLLLACNSAKKTTEDLATQIPISTSLDLTNTSQDKVPVTVNPGRFTNDTVIFRLPRIIQGTYSISDFGKYVDDFKAVNYKGEELSFEKLDTNSWAIYNASDLDIITYYVNDTFDIEKKELHRLYPRFSQYQKCH
jgi:hypothetical protein